MDDGEDKWELKNVVFDDYDDENMQQIKEE